LTNQPYRIEICFRIWFYLISQLLFRVYGGYLDIIRERTYHCVDKIIAVILTASVIITTSYHYYNECIFHTIETNALIINTACLNIYMYYRGVHYVYIILGFGILYVLQVTIEKVEKEKCIHTYEHYHPYCHYIAGFYVMYCVYLIQNTFIEDTCLIPDNYH